MITNHHLSVIFTHIPIFSWLKCHLNYLAGGFNRLEKYEFVNGKEYPIYDLKIKNLWNQQPVTIIINISSTNRGGSQLKSLCLGKGVHQCLQLILGGVFQGARCSSAHGHTTTPRRHGARACGVSFSWVPQSWARHEARKPGSQWYGDLTYHFKEDIMEK